MGIRGQRMNKFRKRGMAVLLSAALMIGALPVQSRGDTKEIPIISQEESREDIEEVSLPEAAVISQPTETEDEPIVTQEERRQSDVVQEESHILQESSDNSSDTEDLDYIKGRPLTEAEIQAQKALEPELTELPEEEIIAQPVLNSNRNTRSEVLGTPAFYDSRNSRLITSVKDQGSTNTCWSYSSLSMAETGAILNNSKFNKDNIDFWEHNLAYWAYASFVDPLGNMTGDSTTPIKSNYLNVGGNYMTSAMTLAQWKGPVAQNDSLSEQGVYDNQAILTEYGAVATSVSEMKAAIMEYGSIGYSFNYQSSNLNYSTAAYCSPEDLDSNHAVTVVGWDDNYDKVNFLPESNVSTNGAWIVKNSYGSKWGENGYFYISYEEPTLSTCHGFRMTSADTYDHNYQYDGTAGAYSADLASNQSFANVYQVKGNQNQGGKESLKAVGFATKQANAKVNVKVYKNLTDLNNPSSGALAYEENSVSVQYVGYHTVPLDQPVELEYGSYYSIVITNAMESNLTLLVEATGNTDLFRHNANIKKGQSFWGSSSGRWDDNANGGYCARIKGYTVDVERPTISPTAAPAVKATKVSLSKTSIKIKKGDKYTLKGSVTPSNTTNKAVKWTTSKSSVATVSSIGVVTAKNYGTATITCTAQDGSGKKASCTVTVGYSLTYKLNGGKNSSSNPTLYYNEKVTLKSPTRAEYTFSGWYTSSTYKTKISSIGKGTKKNYTLYAKWSKVSVSRASTPAVKVTGKGKITVSYKATSGAYGYRIYYSTRSDFKNAKSILTGMRSKSISGLTKGKTYYVRVKAFKKDSGGARVYGSYSGKVKIKITK